VSLTFPSRVFPSEVRHQAGRVWRLARDGGRSLLAEGLQPPVNGLMFHDGGLYVSEGGHPGPISRPELDGQRTVIVDNLPGPGNYHTNIVISGLTASSTSVKGQ
jgi:hypothetical protein